MVDFMGFEPFPVKKTYSREVEELKGVTTPFNSQLYNFSQIISVISQEGFDCLKGFESLKC